VPKILAKIVDSVDSSVGTLTTESLKKRAIAHERNETIKSKIDPIPIPVKKKEIHAHWI